MTDETPMSDVRLIERWMPIGALSEESVRERRSMTALPPTYYLHVWWARRPLIASRAAILASLLPASADRRAFQSALGILGDPVKTRRRIDLAKKTNEDLGLDPYGYRRAFTFTPSEQQLSKLGLAVKGTLTIADPTAGGGSIPFEAIRLGLRTFANDLNPVAATILKATIEYPTKHGEELVSDFLNISGELGRRLVVALADVYPKEPEGHVDGYLWARTITCPYCSGCMPLSPNWRLNNSGQGVRLLPRLGVGPGSSGRVCAFEIVRSVSEHSVGTVSGGDATCPFPDCGRVVGGDEIKRQAQSGGMSDQLFAVAFKRPVEARTKSNNLRNPKWERGYRAPRPEDDNTAEIASRLAEKLAEWQALDVVPSEEIDIISNYDRGHRLYGMHRWIELFSPRQLLSHGLAAEIFREMVGENIASGNLSEVRKASYVYLSLALDTLLNYGNRSCRWDVVTERVRSIFDRHGFCFMLVICRNGHDD